MFTEVAPRIFAAPLFSPRETEAILAIAARHKWHKARVGSKDSGHVVKREQRSAGVLYKRDVPQLVTLLERRVIAATESFVERMSLIGLQIVRYKPGGFYGVHKDNPGGARDNRRETTVVVYLNDDFTGGATKFTKLDYAFTPRAGYVLLFPSRYKHQAQRVTEGTKYIIAAWYERTAQTGVSVPHDPAPAPDQS
jgi:predicted 2-oxoglutarate/Fe(II)-dependent dioxygenase YbiX